MKTRLALAATLILTSACAYNGPPNDSSPKVVYAGTVRHEYDIGVQMRLAQNSVEVQLIGQDRTATLTNTGNYFVMWEEDVAAGARALNNLYQYREAVKLTVDAKTAKAIEAKYVDITMPRAGGD